MSRYEKSIIARSVNIRSRNLIVLGSDYLTDCIYSDAVKMGFHTRKETIESIGTADKDESFVLVAVYTGHKKYYDFLLSLGLEYNEDFSLMNIGGYCRPITAIDPLLTYARDYSEEPQYDVIGTGSYVVAIYGPSTSDVFEGGQKCWPYYLHDALLENGIDSKILAGAVAGYSSGQEALKLFRDITNFKFNLVISFSGVNDIRGGTHIAGYPFINKFQKRMWEHICGIKGAIPDSLDMRNIDKVNFGKINDMDDYEIWINNERRMHAICDEYYVPFIAVLEPLISCGEYNIDNDLLVLLKNAGLDSNFYLGQKQFAMAVREVASNYPYIVDWSGKLGNFEDIFIDSMHYNEKGHEIVGTLLSKLISEHFFAERGDNNENANFK